MATRGYSEKIVRLSYMNTGWGDYAVEFEADSEAGDVRIIASPEQDVVPLFVLRDVVADLAALGYDK